SPPLLPPVHAESGSALLCFRDKSPRFRRGRWSATQDKPPRRKEQRISGINSCAIFSETCGREVFAAPLPGKLPRKFVPRGRSFDHLVGAGGATGTVAPPPWSTGPGGTCSNRFDEIRSPHATTPVAEQQAELWLKTYQNGGQQKEMRKPRFTELASISGGYGAGTSVHPAEPVVERVTRPAYGADGVGHMAAIDRLAQATNMDIDRSFVDVDIGAPDTIEQLLSREHSAWPLHQEFQQAIFGGSEIDRASVARYPFLFPVQFKIADAEHGRAALRVGEAQ